MLQLVNKIHTALNNHEYALGVLFGLSKAFDTVNHIIFTTKLLHYGFTEIISVVLKLYSLSTTALMDRHLIREL